MTRNAKLVRLNYADTHRALVEQCKQGSRQAQFELYKLYSKAMYNICIRMLKNEMDAEDILQNSFVDVFRNLNSFHFQSSVGAWIKRIVINNCINFLKKKRLHIQELEDWHIDISDEPKVDAVKLNTDMIQAALFELPDGYRVVFSLYMFEGYDHKEIAEILGVSESTSKSQYCRARKKLKEILQNKRFVL